MANQKSYNKKELKKKMKKWFGNKNDVNRPFSDAWLKKLLGKKGFKEFEEYTWKL